MFEHGGTDRIVAHICAKTQLFVGFDGVGALVLKIVGANFVDQTYATTFLAQI